MKVEEDEVPSLATNVQHSFPIKPPKGFRGFLYKRRDKGWVEVQKAG